MRVLIFVDKQRNTVVIFEGHQIFGTWSEGLCESVCHHNGDTILHGNHMLHDAVVVLQSHQGHMEIGTENFQGDDSGFLLFLLTVYHLQICEDTHLQSLRVIWQPNHEVCLLMWHFQEHVLVVHFQVQSRQPCQSPPMNEEEVFPHLLIMSVSEEGYWIRCLHLLLTWTMLCHHWHLLMCRPPSKEQILVDQSAD